MNAARRSVVNALVLNLLLAALLYLNASAPDGLAIPPRWEGHLGLGGGTFPPTFILPVLHARLLDLSLWLVLGLAAVELLPLLLPVAWRPRARVVALGQVLMILGLTVNAELVVRQVLWPLRGETILGPDAIRYWTFNPYTTDNRFTVNQHGLRGLEIDPHRQPGEFRILCLGNSVSAGNNLAENQSYPFLLQSYLRKRCPKALIRVQNGAVYGYSAVQGAMVLEDVAEEFQPDLVIVGFSYFEASLVDQAGEPFASHRWPMSRLRSAAFESMVYMTLRQTALSRLAGAGKGSPQSPDPRELTRSDDQSRLTSKYFLWFIQQSRKRGFQLVLYSTYSHTRDHFMIPKERVDKFELQGLYRRMRQPGGQALVQTRPDDLRLDDPNLTQEELAYLYDIPHIDLDRSWRMRPDIGRYLQDSSHPNVAGTVMQATEIGRFLLDQGLVPGGGARTPALDHGRLTGGRPTLPKVVPPPPTAAGETRRRLPQEKPMRPARWVRVTQKLLALSQTCTPGWQERTLPLGLSHQELANMVGSTRAAVTRVMQEMRRQEYWTTIGPAGRS